MRYLLLICFSCVLFMSCEREIDTDIKKINAEKLESSREFLPLAIGREWIYDIDTIYYSLDLGQMNIDTVSGIYKETIQDTFTNISGYKEYRILREKLQANNSTWEVTNVFSYEDRIHQVIRTENNYNLIEFIHPIENSSTWSPTALIDGNTSLLVRGKAIQLFKDWPKAYISEMTNEPFLGYNTNMVKIIDVEPNDDIILSQYSKRHYGRGLGLTYKYQAFYTTQQTQLANHPWNEKADIGFETTQRLISFK